MKSHLRKFYIWLRTRREGKSVDRAARTSARFRFYGQSTFVDELSDAHGSDKAGSDPGGNFAWPPHQYGLVYDLLFGGCRQAVDLVFECGVGSTSAEFKANMGPSGVPGASLRMWRDYFPRAEIFGADIDPNVIFQEDRISTRIMDQTDPDSVLDYWRAVNVSGFDVMIDDGLHEVKAGKILFENSHEHLKAEGLYIIEDVRKTYVLEYASMARDAGFNAAYVGFEQSRYGPNAADGLMILRRCNRTNALWSE